MKKFCIGLLALALSALSCKHSYDIDPFPERSRCFNLYFEAKQISAEERNSDMVKMLSEGNWCESIKRSVSEDIKILEDYINSQD